MGSRGTATILRADARALPLPDATVDLIVTSPPYFALRSYTDGGEHYDGQIGAEPTPAAYIESLLVCTREWMRVLKPSGSIFVNLGDKYSTYDGPRTVLQDSEIGRRQGAASQTESVRYVKSAPLAYGIPYKSLMLLPERYRIACVDQLGLIARAVVVWEKPNGMPESVTDRVRRSHEDWVHLVKQPRYFSAVDYLREPHIMTPQRRLTEARGGRRGLPASVAEPHLSRPVRLEPGTDGHPLGKLPGSVREVATEPLSVPEHLGVEHFAAFPTEWPRWIIWGWSPSGICSACGDGRRPTVERDRIQTRRGLDSVRGVNDGSVIRMSGGSGFGQRAETTVAITGEACSCSVPNAPTWPSVVLDPFGGTGTTALVAMALGRHGISGDRSADYCRLARWRTTDPGQLAKVLGVPKPPAELDGQLGFDLFAGVG